MANENRLIDANAVIEELTNFTPNGWGNDVPYIRSQWAMAVKIKDNFLKAITEAPTVDAVEVVHGYKPGDVCFYGFHDGNKSLALVEIVKILDDERGIAEVKFLKVFVDNTGNGFFNYLLRSGGTMNASFKYLQNITPIGAKMDGGNEDGKV